MNKQKASQAENTRWAARPIAPDAPDNFLAAFLDSAVKRAGHAATRRWLKRLREHGEFVQLVQVKPLAKRKPKRRKAGSHDETRTVHPYVQALRERAGRAGGYKDKGGPRYFDKDKGAPPPFNGKQ